MIIPKSGFVYIIGSEVGLYKIGKTTKDANQRFHALKTGSPVEITLIHKIHCDDCSEVEKQYHEHFKSKRVRGEWFRLDEWDLLWLKDIEKINHDSENIVPPSWEQYMADAIDEADHTDMWIEENLGAF